MKRGENYNKVKERETNNTNKCQNFSSDMIPMFVILPIYG